MIWPGHTGHSHARLICSRRVFPASLQSATFAAETSSGLRPQSVRARLRCPSCTKSCVSKSAHLDQARRRRAMVVLELRRPKEVGWDHAQNRIWLYASNFFERIKTLFLALIHVLACLRAAYFLKVLVINSASFTSTSVV